MAPAIEVYPRDEFARFRGEVPWAGISITTDHGDWPEVDRSKCVGLLRLHFADLEEPAPGERLFDESDACRILDYVSSIWPDVDLLVIHCQAGLRRSPAVAAAISRIKFGEDAEWFRPGVYEPNMLVYVTLLTVAQQRGEFDEPRIPRRKRKRNRRRGRAG